MRKFEVVKKFDYGRKESYHVIYEILDNESFVVLETTSDKILLERLRSFGWCEICFRHV